MTRSIRLRSLAGALAVLSTPLLGVCCAGASTEQTYPDADRPWMAGFQSSAHHWRDLTDEDRVISPRPEQPRYPPSNVIGIANNVLLYQKSNGGWPKNYDMRAILTEDQIAALEGAREQTTTTFDNGATHSQVHYLAFAYRETGDECYRDACLRGLDFMLSAQYENGGWPQAFPDRSGYRRYITFNDGAMIGVMSVLRRIVLGDRDFAFVDDHRREAARVAYRKGLECILRCQVVEQGRLRAWCQQHDEKDFRPRGARTFELPSLASEESAQIVLFLMSITTPDAAIVRAISAAVQWFEGSALSGIRVKTIHAPHTEYRYHSSREDKVVVQDPDAPPIWARYYELETGRPLFCNRDGKPVYSLGEVERERRTGYAWYSYAPQQVLEEYPLWHRKATAGEPMRDVPPEHRQR
jgi:PelA/Pel-15E family pectate lyase